jgi:hypothetical protein
VEVKLGVLPLYLDIYPLEKTSCVGKEFTCGWKGIEIYSIWKLF